MKRNIVILLCLCTTLTSFAQWNNNQQRQRQGAQNEQRQEQWQRQRQFSPELFNQQQEQFVTKEAGLTPAEAQKFFPMMHEMLNKQREINTKIQHYYAQCFGDKDEREYEEIINKVIALEVESRKIEQTYYKKFHTVLSWKKIYRVRFALSRWNMEVLKMFNPQQQQQQNRQLWPGQGQRNTQNPYWNR